MFVKIDSMSGCDIRFVFTFPPKDSTLQYKKNVYTSEITFLALLPCVKGTVSVNSICTLYAKIAMHDSERYP